MIQQDIQKILYEKILKQVEKPGRYIGKEYNEIVKNDNCQRVKIALAFPDLYEIGMSYLGFKILYEIINSRDDALAERVFSPAADMERLMQSEGVPLFGLEGYTPLGKFDLVGFSLQHELCFTNVLHLLDLGKIPLKSKDRDLRFPLIMAGGPSAFNPEPLADFIDFFVIGDGEDVIHEIIELYQGWKHSGKKEGKDGLLRQLRQLKGIYIPSFYKVHYFPDGRIHSYQPVKEDEGVPLPIQKRIASQLDDLTFPTAPVVPNISIVHNRITLEIFRGCTRGCRFCQAGMIYRPVRERSEEKILELAEKSIENTGYEEISLCSLSSSDYTNIENLIRKLVDRYQEKGVGVSLPSLRVDSFSVDLAKETQRVRKTGLTFAPEVGTQRMSDVVNKNVSEEDLLKAVESAFKAGWKRIKLYFMIGLPTETREDVEGIVQLIKKVEGIGRKMAGRKFSLNVSINSFIPKSHTPFQWTGMDDQTQLMEKYKYIIQNIRSKSISYSFSDLDQSLLEAVFARGDRRLGKVLEEAYRKGCKFDSWRESFYFDRWKESFEKNHLSLSFYAHRKRERDEVFPWDMIDCGVSKKYLCSEWEKAQSGVTTGDCRGGKCQGCGLQQSCIMIDEQ